MKTQTTRFSRHRVPATAIQIITGPSRIATIYATTEASLAIPAKQRHALIESGLRRQIALNLPMKIDRLPSSSTGSVAFVGMVTIVLDKKPRQRHR